MNEKQLIFNFESLDKEDISDGVCDHFINDVMECSPEYDNSYHEAVSNAFL